MLREELILQNFVGLGPGEKLQEDGEKKQKQNRILVSFTGPNAWFKGVSTPALTVTSACV